MTAACTPGGEDLSVLIERSADLKRDLVDFACSPRWKRSLAAAKLEVGLEEVDEGLVGPNRYGPRGRPPHSIPGQWRSPLVRRAGAIVTVKGRSTVKGTDVSAARS